MESMTGKKRTSALRNFVLLSMLAAMFGLAGCAAQGKGTTLAAKAQGPRFNLELSPGRTYKTTTGWFIFRYPIYPQVAAWVETLDGRYLGTIYVTGKAERKNWLGAPAAGRPEALPVWSHLEKEKLDAVAAATSPGETARYSSLAEGLPEGEYAILLETNRSYDYNSTYTQAASGVNGQPSIVYKALIQVGKGSASARFTPLGTGSMDGSDGSVRPGLDGLDTALELFSSMTVEYRE